MTGNTWTDVRVAVTGSSILVDGASVELAPGCDALTTVIQHVAQTTAVPQQRQVWVTMRDEDGVSRFVVGPHGRAWMVTPEGSR